ncbi:MAG: glycosyltransferase [Elusimicrobiota bacterium]
MNAHVYLAYGGIEATVFDSQVITFLEGLRRGAGIISRPVVFQDLKTYYFARASLADPLARLETACGQKPILLPRIPRDLASLDTTMLKRTLTRHHTGTVTIHARGTQSAHLAARLKSEGLPIKLIYDCRGVEAHESLDIARREKLFTFAAYNDMWFKRIIAMEKEASRAADKIFCVSETLKGYLMDAHGISPDRIDVIPGCVNTAIFRQDETLRATIRRNLGLGSRFVLAFTGSMRAWQQPQTLALALRAAKNADKNALLLAITTDTASLTKELLKTGFTKDDYRVMSLAHKDVAAHLTAADCGLLIREPTLVNQVAWPTKALEYLACGLPLVTTKAPEDISRLVRTHNVGAVAESHDETGLSDAIKCLQALSAQDTARMRSRAVALAKERFDWKIVLPLVIDRYRQLDAA